jgi:16S rRNA G966 N2-methylase RsmD
MSEEKHCDAVARKMENIEFLLGSNHKEWHYEPKYLIYITPQYISQKLGELIIKKYGPVGQIWDMFSGIGTDTINIYGAFLKAGFCETKFICTEIDQETYENLKRNCEKFFLDPVSTVINTDCVMHLSYLTVNDADPETLVYFDPPWGDNYDQERDYDFRGQKLSNGVDIADLSIEVHRKFKNIIIKSPRNCNTFEELFGDSIKSVYRFPKLKFLFLQG